MKRKIKGSFTIEAAIIVPIILFVFGLLVTILFYCHDKTLLMSVAHETLAIGCGREDMTVDEMEQYFDRRIQGKTLLFSHIKNQIWIVDKKEIRIACSGKKHPLSCTVKYKMKRTKPEDYIRSSRKIMKMQKGQENNIENIL